MKQHLHTLKGKTAKFLMQDLGLGEDLYSQYISQSPLTTWLKIGSTSCQVKLTASSFPFMTLCCHLLPRKSLRGLAYQTSGRWEWNSLKEITYEWHQNRQILHSHRFWSCALILPLSRDANVASRTRVTNWKEESGWDYKRSPNPCDLLVRSHLRNHIMKPQPGSGIHKCEHPHCLTFPFLQEGQTK